ncbi:polyphosphate kinase [Flavobacteriaceae bacterium MAR_2010_188]|nr:polyphosphate kinase [Flavobacteriaceae bacterium MAR_2010_188]
MASLYNDKYYHRDLSWLRFNHRVLQEVADRSNPLYERIKFLAIFSSNLDEFFRVRVSDIRQIKKIEKPLRKKLITKPNKVLKEIKNQVHEQQQLFGSIFYDQIIPDLAKENIHLIEYHTYSEQQKEIAAAYYEDKLRDKLDTFQFKKNVKDTVFVENQSSYLIGRLNDKDFEIVKLPEDEDRFFVFPSVDGHHYITFIDDILKFNLNRIHPLQEKLQYYALKISRDAELYIDDEFSGNLAEKIRDSLPKRNEGQATRVLVDQRMPEKFMTVLKSALDVYNADIVLGGRYHNFKDFFKFPNPSNTDFEFKALPPLPHPIQNSKKSIFELIDEKDQLLHYPYQSFESVLKLAEAAAEDDSVTTIKMTMYRLAEDSRLNEAIAKAAKKGKDVTVFIEVKARFDEKNNLKWGEIFAKNGANVIYSYPAIKVHSKIMYIERTEGKKTKRYGYIATGNFNEHTARLYTDFGLMTADNKITKDLKRVFMVLERKIIVPKTTALLVSPFTTREQFSEMVENEIHIANSGKKGLIVLKMNSLEDDRMIKLLYKASNAGVEIKLLIRGICSLVPGIKGQSENISITSILDRFLEHGRVYLFGNGGDEQLYIGSADWMTRNLTHRIEVVTPILDKDHHKTIKDILNIQLSDNVKARIIDKDQKNEYVEPTEPKIRSQYATYEYFQNQEK